ncbi:MAG: hypothetical protein HC789_21845 [Microcoleus sp. CSU_2_2]|nr:hypothetical protein [Microcoleus sp. SU_5_3]NJS12826.1 hypothetical protein [Microcoleus sp. CSU_2_2]
MPVVKFSEQNLVRNSFRGQNLKDFTFFKTKLKNVRFDRNNAGTRTQLRRTNFSESFTGEGLISR